MDKAYELNGLIYILVIFRVRLLPSLENAGALRPPNRLEKICFMLSHKKVLTASVLLF